MSHTETADVISEGDIETLPKETFYIDSIFHIVGKSEKGKKPSLPFSLFPIAPQVHIEWANENHIY